MCQLELSAMKTSMSQRLQNDATRAGHYEETSPRHRFQAAVGHCAIDI
jgi:hypothetical protein